MDYRAEDRPALTDVVITQPMIQAGLAALSAAGLVDDLLEADSEVVVRIYRAMWSRASGEASSL